MPSSSAGFLVGLTYSWGNQAENFNIPLVVEAVYCRKYIINYHYLELQSDNNDSFVSPQHGRAASRHTPITGPGRVLRVCHNLERQCVCSVRWYQRVDWGEGVQTDLIN